MSTARTWVLVIGLSLPSSGLACDVPASSDRVAAAMAGFVDAWEAMKADEVEAAAAHADEAMGCASDPLLPTEVALYFQIRGLARWLQGDKSAALRAFHTAVTVVPTAELPERLAAPDDEWTQLYAQARQRPSSEEAALAEPAEGWLHVDGSRRQSHPLHRPFVLQHFDNAGEVLATHVVAAGGDIPPYEVEDVPVETLPGETLPSRRKGRAPGWVGVATGGALVVGGAIAAGLASQARSELAPSCEDNVCLSLAKNDVGAYNRLRVLSSAGFIAGGVVLGAGVVGVTIDGGGRPLGRGSQ